jgi:hypothetical protein
MAFCRLTMGDVEGGRGRANDGSKFMESISDTSVLGGKQTPITTTMQQGTTTIKRDTTLVGDSYRVALKKKRIKTLSRRGHLSTTTTTTTTATNTSSASAAKAITHIKPFRVRVRPCVWQLLFVIPLATLLLERQMTIWLGSYEDWSLAVESAWKELYTDNSNNRNDIFFSSSLSPEQVQLLQQRRSHARPLSNITQSTRRAAPCPAGLRGIVDIVKYLKQEDGRTTRPIVVGENHPLVPLPPTPSTTIPSIVHQTAPSRCLTPLYATGTYQWMFLTKSGTSYFFHDTAAMDRLLLETYLPEFPHLTLVVQHCLHASESNSNSSSSSAGNREVRMALWQWLVLWLYGGIYADLNLVPTNETVHLFRKKESTTTNKGGEQDRSKSKIHNSQKIDAILMLHPTSNLIRLDFMAFAPRHPLLYYSIQNLVTYIARDAERDKNLIHTAFHEAMSHFQVRHQPRLGLDDNDDDNSQNGIVYVGPHNRSIRVLAEMSGKSYFQSVIRRPLVQKSEYDKMNFPFTISSDGGGGGEPLHLVSPSNQGVRPSPGQTTCFHSMYEGVTTGH